MKRVLLNPSAHLLMVLITSMIAISPIYWIDGLSSWKPSRAIGSLIFLKSKSPAVEVVDSAVIQTTESIQKSEERRSSRQPESEKPAAVPAAASEKSTPGVVGIEGEEHLKHFFQALKQSAQSPVRVLQYGDSTLAADNITRTIRSRIQAQFGDAGPGFFVAGMDPRWMKRDDVRVTRTGDWDVSTILFGGNQGRYGLGGIVAKSKQPNTISIAGPKPGGSIGQRIELYTQTPKREESIKLEVNGTTPLVPKRDDKNTFTHWVVESPEPIKSLKISVLEPNLEVYGAVVENSRGVTWETTAVVGVSSISFKQFTPAHLAEQTATRRPDLIVLMIGGNETGHGGIFSPGGKVYKESFVGALRTIRQGSPKSACLVMSPLDQGEQNDDGNVSSKKSVSRMVQLQKEVALEEGCAFWNSWKFMGGEGSFVRWLNQGLAWTDLAHFTAPGLQRIGNGFADALLNSYKKFEEGN